MAETCAELQEAGDSGELTQATGLLDRLGTEFERVRSAFEAELSRSES